MCIHVVILVSLTTMHKTRTYMIVRVHGHSILGINQPRSLVTTAQARLSGIHVIVASVEGSAANLELKGMASAPHEATLFNAPRFSQLPAMVDSIVSATCDGAYMRAYWLHVIV